MTGENDWGVGTSTWAFLTNHGQVLVCLADDPGMRLRDIGDRVGITERAAHRIVAELVADGFVERERLGRRNRYTINADLPLPDPIARELKIGELLRALTAVTPSEKVAGAVTDRATAGSPSV
ncbi:MAG: helix-turn-helix transcriptional regulator [Solirubrobacteraceae bacterium]